MLRNYLYIRNAILLSLLFTSVTLSNAVATPLNEAQPERYIVISHPNTENKTMSMSKLQGIFSLKIKYWDDETPIKVYATNPLENEYHNFCKLNLGIFSHQLQRAWDRLTYSGRASSPTIVASFEEMIEAVSNTPGAIGYIPHNALNDVTNKLELKIGNDNEG